MKRHQSTEQATCRGWHVDHINLPHLLEDTTGLFGFGELASHVEHALDDWTDKSSIA